MIQNPNYNVLEAWGQRDYKSPNYRVSLGLRNGDDFFIGLPLKFEKVDEGAMVAPTLDLNPESAQQLMNELWSMGLRPQGEATMGMLEMQARHLADMRQIAFSKIQVPLPESFTGDKK